MTNSAVTIHPIPLWRLIPHPRHANRMPRAMMEKLRRNLARTGHYEPLIVRPHPRLPRCFELLHGHHRREALRTLGHREAACLIWKMSDAEALLFLATVNRLAGREAANKRVALLEALTKIRRAGVRNLADFLPEDARALAALRQSRRRQKPVRAPKSSTLPEAFTVFLPAEQKQQLLAALAATHRDKAQALLAWANASQGATGLPELRRSFEVQQRHNAHGHPPTKTRQTRASRGRKR